MNFLLRVWRQKDPKAKGKLVDYEATGISPNTSFLEMLDVVNEGLVARGEEPIAFDSDCREGICGSCETRVVSGVPEHRDSVLTPAEQAELESYLRISSFLDLMHAKARRTLKQHS